jgi:rhodanese-related sulfurtransferase
MAPTADDLPMAQILEFAGNHPYLVGALLGLAVLLVVTEIRARTGGVDMAPGDAVRLINNGATVVDIRPPERYAAGHIIGAVNIPAGEIGARANEVAKRKDRPVLVCCDTGTDAGRAAAILRKANYPNVVRLQGGVTAWERENLPLERAQGGKKQKSKNA